MMKRSNRLKTSILAIILTGISAAVAAVAGATAANTNEFDWYDHFYGVVIFNLGGSTILDPPPVTGVTYPIECRIHYDWQEANGADGASPPDPSLLAWDLDGNGTFETSDDPSRIGVYFSVDGVGSGSGMFFVERQFYPESPGVHSVGCKMTLADDTTVTPATSFTIYQAPPAGPVGVSVDAGAEFTRSQNVRLNIIWPRGAQGVMISNDGGFPASGTRNFPVTSAIEWKLNSSITGMFTKNVYIRFSGVSYLVDAQTIYSDDIVLDTTAPEIVSAMAQSRSTADPARQRGRIAVKATDDISGVANLQVNSKPNVAGAKTIKYGATVTASGKSTFVRAQDRAGNWSKWQKVARGKKK